MPTLSTCAGAFFLAHRCLYRNVFRSCIDVNMAQLIYMIGAPGIGKTSLLDQLCQTKTSDIGPTLGVEMRSWSYNLNGHLFRFRIWDISGKTFYAHLMENSIQGGDITIICYDLRNATEFKNIKKWITLVEQSPYPQSLILYGIVHDYEERQIMPSDVHKVAEHVRNRRNCRSVHVVEGRIEDRFPLFEAVIAAAKTHRKVKVVER